MDREIEKVKKEYEEKMKQKKAKKKAKDEDKAKQDDDKDDDKAQKERDDKVQRVDWILLHKLTYGQIKAIQTGTKDAAVDNGPRIYTLHRFLPIPRVWEQSD